MVSTAATDRVSRGENEGDPRIYHVFVTNLLIRGVRRLTALSRIWQDGRIGAEPPSRRMHRINLQVVWNAKKPACFNNHNSLAYFLRSFGCVPARGEGSDAAGGKNTIRRAVAAQYGDIVKHRAVALDVEYRSKAGKPVSGSINRVL